MHEHWYWWGAGMALIGVTFLAIADTQASPPSSVNLWTEWEALLSYCIFLLAFVFGVAGVRNWRFPLRAGSGEGDGRGRASQPPDSSTRPLAERSELERAIRVQLALDALIDKGEKLKERELDRRNKVKYGKPNLLDKILSFNPSRQPVLWFVEVGTFVDENCPKYSDQIVVRKLSKNSTSKEIVDALNQKIDALRAIREDVEVGPVDLSA